MKTKLIYKLIAIAAFLLADRVLVHAGTFIINVDGLVITATDTDATSNNASIGYDNTITSSTNAFIHGSTNSVSNFVNASIVGANNQITKSGGVTTGSNAGAFGNNNTISFNGYGTFASNYAFGASNTITVPGSNSPGQGITHAFTFGADNTIANAVSSISSASINEVFLLGKGNSATNSNTGRNGISSVYVLGNANNITDSIDGGLGNFYAIGSGNNMGNNGGWFSNAYAIGAGNTIAGTFNSALSGAYMLGSGNKIQSTGTTTIGAAGNSSVTNALALGANNTITSSGSSGALANTLALGSNNTITNTAGNTTTTDAYAIGSNNTITDATRVVALGHNNTIAPTAANTYILGANITATNVNSVILGNSSADATASPVSTITIGANAPAAVAGSAPVGVVSVGAAGRERQIVNVASGRVTTNSTDAINGSQLYVTNTTLAAISAVVAALASAPATSTDALLWNSTLNAYDATHGTSAPQRITNIANGLVAANSSDAITGSQLHATAASIATILGTGTLNPDGSITNTTFITGGTTINQALTNIHNQSASLASDALSWNTTLNAYDASHGTSTPQRITNIASGLIAANSLDAINGSQLYATATSIVALLGTGTVNANGTITGGTSINQSITNLDQSITNLTQTVNNILAGSAGLVRQDTTTGDITLGAQTGGSTLNIAGTNGDRQLTGLAPGAADNDAVTIAQLKTAGIITTATTGAATIANIVAYDDSTKTTITLGAPTATGTGANITGGTRLTNLAQAALTAASTDAVIGSQLHDTNQRVTTLETAVSTLTTLTANLTTTVANTIPGNPHFSTGNDDPDIPATATGGNAVAAGMGATASGASSSAIGMGATATAANSIAIGSLSVSQAQGGVALGNNAIVAATAANSVAIGANSVATEPNTVSFGSEFQQRRLVNIADGINPADAVTMRQLTAYQDATRNNLANLQDRVNTLGARIDTVGAMSAAMNQVQPRLSVSTGNRNQLALGVGGYRGHGAFAMGYGYTCPQGDRGVQASFALSDTGEVMAGAGAIFGW